MPAGNAITTGDITDSTGIAIGEGAGVFIDQIIQLGSVDDPDQLQALLTGALRDLGFDQVTLSQLEQSRPSQENQQRIEQLEHFVQKSLAEGARMTAQTAYNLGMLAVYRGDREEALNHFHRAASLDPEMAAAFFAISWLEQSLAKSCRFQSVPDYETALLRLQKAQEAASMVDPQNERSLTLLGYIANSKAQIAELIGDGEERARQYAESERLFKLVLEANPNNASAYNGLGNVYYAQNEFDKMIASCKQAVALDRDYLAAYKDLGLAYYLRMQQDEGSDLWYEWYEKAVLALEQAHDLAETEADAAARVDYYRQIERLQHKLKLDWRRHKILYD